MSQFYNRQINSFLARFSEKEITALLVTGLYVFSPEHLYENNIPRAAIIDRAVMTGVEIKAGGFYADDLIFPNTKATDPSATRIIFAFSETGALLAHIDEALSIAPNGENIHIRWNGPVFTF